MNNQKKSMEFRNNFTSVQYFFKQILQPVLSNQKFNFLFTISKNWKNIVGLKYNNYCYIEKVVLNKENKQGSVYIISNNSAVSFYLNNNKQYITEKINVLFGYKAVLNIYIKEIPLEITKQDFLENKIIKITEYEIDEIKNTFNIEDQELKKSLAELKITINSSQK